MCVFGKTVFWMEYILIVYLDAIRVKVKHNGQIVSKAVWLAIAVTTGGVALGMWTAEAEESKFWSSILNEIKNRGVKDILIACVDGLKGFPENNRLTNF